MSRVFHYRRRIIKAACLIALFIVGFSARLAADDRPNILFAISDDQSWMHCGAYGDASIRTPAFDRIAREGVLFTHAYCSAPSCAPARAAILTGRNIWELEEGGLLFGKLKQKYRPFTLDLREAGYQLAATGKTWGPGVTDGLRLTVPPGKNTSRPSIFGAGFNGRKLKKKIPGINANDYAANFEAFLAQRNPDQPFFFWYGATEPHQNYAVGRWKTAGKKLSDANVPKCLPDHETVRGEFLDYALEVEHFDQHLARMLKVLEKAGELKNTIVIVTGDHGNPMPRSKCNLYDSGTRVPLAIRWPRKIPASRVVTQFVSHIDLGATIQQAAGLKVPEDMSGRSLWGILSGIQSGKNPDRDFVVTAFERHILCRRNGIGYPMRSIRTHQFALIRNYEPDRWPAGDPDFLSSHQGYYGDCDRGESKKFVLANAQSAPGNGYYRLCFGRRPALELYDMERDPDQLANLAADPKYQQVIEELESKMNAYLKRTGDPRQRGESPWDRYPFSDRRLQQFPNWKKEGFPTRLPLTK